MNNNKVEKYPKTITKDEINELPLIRFNGDIHIIESSSDMYCALEDLNKHSILGIDTETRPSYKKGKQYNVALLQIATNNTAYLFRLNKINFPPELIQILENTLYKKIGLALHDDVIALKKYTEFKPSNFIDLRKVAHSLELQKTGLRELTAMFLKKRISKQSKLTNWENEILTPAQVNYAATDAWICVEIYNYLLENKIIDLKNEERHTL